MMKQITLTFLALLCIPDVITAAGPDFIYFEDAIDALASLINQLIPIVIALALLFFIWGIVQFILASGDEEAKEDGKRKIVWGIISLFVIVSVWGLVGLLNQLTGIEQGQGFETLETGI